MNNLVKVKKIVNMNPTRYKTISLSKAVDMYQDYLDCLAFAYNRQAVGKDFISWLETEI